MRLPTCLACTYLYFQGMPFDDQNDFPIAIGIVNEAVESYPYAQYGWKRSDNGPVLGMGAEAGNRSADCCAGRKNVKVSYNDGLP